MNDQESESLVTAPAASTTTTTLYARVWEGFQSLRASPSELWKAYTLKFLDSYSYFSFSLIFTLFLSSDFGFSDVEAGTIYGAWGALITIYGLVAGCLIDNLGVARSLQVGFGLSLVSRCMIFLTTSRTVLLLNVCVLLPMGNCLGIPVLTTGIRRYTNDGNRGFAFGLFYVVMNVAALLSGPAVDACTIFYKKGTVEPPVNDSWTLTGYRIVILTGIVANVVAVLVTWKVREIKLDHVIVRDDDKYLATPSRTYGTRHRTTLVHQDQNDPEEARRFRPPPRRQVSKFTPLRGSAMEILKETMHTPSFWRFLAVCLITLNVRMIFRHLDATLPKYMMREFGKNVPFGTIYSINPALIILLVPLITAATSKVDPLVMIRHGSYISAASVFFLVASTSIWSSVMFVTVLSIGEAIWSPRLYDYTMSVTKEGREGTYMALSSAPLFLAKLPVGFMSGKLLETYCPEEGPRNSKMMWTIIGLTTIVSPILMTLFWNYVSAKDEGSSEKGDLNGVCPTRAIPPARSPAAAGGQQEMKRMAQGATSQMP